ncbi:DUF4126 domain-containing protein [Nitrococcus mobilis]|uniref:DUF4126 domain-containing protein n=1 Tax=Nitrococcus mobilis Nb-231 TaxID=314278 RepID=A4BPS5_9GAMM|nr:DUF4126 domain-containing protein [Nitrococcus mobilis]EAR22080.1 hypothetical protein NB231_04205 [Nitrococcus mobilis Nb-231]
MEPLSALVSTIALTLGVGWASGINLYATILTLGFLHNAGYMSLPTGLAICADPLVMAAAGAMYCIEFFADKIPGVDSGWDTLHTFIRIPAGAALAAGAAGDVAPAVQVAAGLAGGTLAAGTHTLKAGGRVLINTSPEPFTNWTASVLEDVAVVTGLWTALQHPWFFLLALAAFLLLMVWLLPRIWRGIRGLLRALAELFRRTHHRESNDTTPSLPPPRRKRLPP